MASLAGLAQNAPMDMTFDTFRAQALARGFDEVLERQWAPHTVLDEHTHPFAADAVVAASQLRRAPFGPLPIDDVTQAV